jgi:hypothetical protein
MPLESSARVIASRVPSGDHAKDAMRRSAKLVIREGGPPATG